MPRGTARVPDLFPVPASSSAQLPVGSAGPHPADSPRLVFLPLMKLFSLLKINSFWLSLFQRQLQCLHNGKDSSCHPRVVSGRACCPS